MRLNRVRKLDIVVGVAYVAFVVVEVYRFHTQGYLDISGLVMATIAPWIYIRNRSPEGHPNPKPTDWVVGGSLVLLGGCIAFGLIWTFAFSDSRSQRLNHAEFTTVAVGMSALLFFWANAKFGAPNKAASSTPPADAPVAPPSGAAGR